MKKALILVFVLSIVVGTGALMAIYAGPAPNSGDGVPDGSGYETPPGPIGGGDPFGPAPNAGDGVPDGSGLTPPNGPI